MAVCKQLGTPQDPQLTTLPRWPAKAPRFPQRPWPVDVAKRLGASGVALLQDLLSWLPARRPTAAGVSAHAFLAPSRFGLQTLPAPMGPNDAAPENSFQGSRHPWNICVGEMAVEVLDWLRDDEALRPGTPAFQALAVDFQAARRDAKSEEGRKFIMAGAVGECGSGNMCGLSLARPLPLRRLQAWHAALRYVNANAFAALDASAKIAVRQLSEEDRGRNGDQFLSQNFREWFCSCGELVFVQPGCKSAGFWAEPEHQDGGASILHLGVTLYGRRLLRCRQGVDLPDVLVPNTPGTVYVGQLTGPHHQVTHEPSEPYDLLYVDGLGHCGVNVMMRTALFSYDRARLRRTTPSPVTFFQTLARCFRDSFAEHSLRLPSLKECLDAFGE